MGGVEANTLDVLVAGSDNTDIRKDSVVTEDADYARPQPKTTNLYDPDALYTIPQRRKLTFDYSTPAKTDRIASNGSRRPCDIQPWRKISYATSVLEDAAYDEGVEDVADEYDLAYNGSARPPDNQAHHTLYLAGLSEHTTHKDVLGVIKGGRVVSMMLRKGGACVTLASGAVDFLAWTKRNDIYLQGKRVSTHQSFRW